MITFKDVSKTFTIGKREVHAVRNVNLTIEEGEIFGIIGFSGAGKSTLLRLVNVLENPTAGAVEVQGVDLASLRPTEVRKVRRRIGMIFQNFNLLTSRTVAGNVAYPLKLAKMPRAKIKERVEELLRFVGLSDKAKDYPEQLSGGQKQRVGIARALATSPDILICDEATSALDPDTTGEILRLLKKVNKEFGITILLITHEMHVIQSICDKVAVMEDGEVIESGGVFDTFTSPVHQTTKRFIRSVQQDLPSSSLLDEWRQKGGKQLYRIIFKGEVASDPILSRVTRKHDIDVNIVYGSVQEIQAKFYGNLLVSFDGDEGKTASAVKELDEIVQIEEVDVAWA
ncbi:methionine ABC transporter ATP-binding protein [Terribacillus saccharophilus]|uniref:D-methionine transport system ATP-binding protein n=1 Tax=Terribacillus saccharophilus TaxID=361277 RepID=A0AAX2EGL5_9BACI|nr:ATP-binding cassette domain-containing protein [Terribacillus goriensis]MEC0281647.1 ATP-binding cassette domain-containing protein [Terribacillus saccharophilus]MEC0291565.1 ATP-binding cassette domain-containing protein [Terribacillus saccharophilus]SEN45996.1 D-methionine transport system ATP-binding protein [Terribacillus saccharophilus]